MPTRTELRAHPSVARAVLVAVLSLCSSGTLFADPSGHPPELQPFWAAVPREGRFPTAAEGSVPDSLDPTASSLDQIASSLVPFLIVRGEPNPLLLRRPTEASAWAASIDSVSLDVASSTSFMDFDQGLAVLEGRGFGATSTAVVRDGSTRTMDGLIVLGRPADSLYVTTPMPVGMSTISRGDSSRSLAFHAVAGVASSSSVLLLGWDSNREPVPRAHGDGQTPLTVTSIDLGSLERTKTSGPFAPGRVQTIETNGREVAVLVRDRRSKFVSVVVASLDRGIFAHELPNGWAGKLCDVRGGYFPLTSEGSLELYDSVSGALQTRIPIPWDDFGKPFGSVLGARILGDEDPYGIAVAFCCRKGARSEPAERLYTQAILSMEGDPLFELVDWPGYRQLEESWYASYPPPIFYERDGVLVSFVKDLGVSLYEVPR